MKGIIVFSLLLAGLLTVCITPTAVYAQGVEDYADITVEGTSGEAGEQVSLRIKVEAKDNIHNILATVGSLAPELVLIQKTGEVELIQSGEMRIISIPIGTSEQTPEGRYRVTYQVDFTDSSGAKHVVQGEAFITVTSASASEGCFIATAAYGTDTVWEIDILREFRDEILLPNSLGAEFVSLYYRTSPPIADFISEYEILRTIVREGFVDPIVAILNWTQDLWSD